MKTRLPFLLLSLLLVALLAACGGGGGNGNVPASAIATVNATPITKASFASLLTVACARYKAQGQPCPKVPGICETLRLWKGKGPLNVS